MERNRRKIGMKGLRGGISIKGDFRDCCMYMFVVVFFILRCIDNFL